MTISFSISTYQHFHIYIFILENDVLFRLFYLLYCNVYLTTYLGLFKSKFYLHSNRVLLSSHTYIVIILVELTTASNALNLKPAQVYVTAKFTYHMLC